MATQLDIARNYLLGLGYPAQLVDALGAEDLLAMVEAAQQRGTGAPASPADLQPNPDVIAQLAGQWQDVLALALWKLSPSTPVLLSREDGATFDALKGDIVLTVQGHPDGIVLALMPKAMIPA